MSTFVLVVIRFVWNWDAYCVWIFCTTTQSTHTNFDDSSNYWHGTSVFNFSDKHRKESSLDLQMPKYNNKNTLIFSEKKFRFVCSKTQKWCVSIVFYWTWIELSLLQTDSLLFSVMCEHCMECMRSQVFVGLILFIIKDKHTNAHRHRASIHLVWHLFVCVQLTVNKQFLRSWNFREFNQYLNLLITEHSFCNCDCCNNYKSLSLIFLDRTTRKYSLFCRKIAAWNSKAFAEHSFVCSSS